jgi:hypothetical protein
MSKWKGTPEGLNSAQAAMIHRTNRDEALDMLEEHSFGGLSDWMDWRVARRPSSTACGCLREPSTMTLPFVDHWPAPKQTKSEGVAEQALAFASPERLSGSRWTLCLR